MKAFYILILTFVCGSFIYSQDTILSKEMKLKTFELTSIEYSKFLHFNGIADSSMNKIEFTECYSVKPVDNISFRLNYGEGSKLIFYKDIFEIKFFKNKSKFTTGLWQGAIAGGVVGLLVALTTKDNSPKSLFDISNSSNKIARIIAVPVFGALGALIGGAIGAFIKEKETYDFTEVITDKRKDKALNIFQHYQLNF